MIKLKNSENPQNFPEKSKKICQIFDERGFLADPSCTPLGLLDHLVQMWINKVKANALETC